MPNAESKRPQALRALSAADLIELREIGYPDAALTGDSPLAVSPDGRHVAFLLSRADVASNAYCRGLVVLRIDRPSESHALDLGGDFVPLRGFVRGLLVDVGLQRQVPPAWSPDGRSIAFLKRSRGVTQAVVVSLADPTFTRTTGSPTDVEDLWWRDSGTLMFASRPGLARASSAIEQEGRSGWLYDSRFAPNYGARPRVEERDAPLETLALSLRDGSVARERAGGREAETQEVRSSTGRRVWASPDARGAFAPDRLHATGPKGETVRCGDVACAGTFAGFWWSPDERAVWFLKREGWNGETSAFYRWPIGRGRPVRTMATTDAIQNCVAAAGRLVCTQENASNPRRIVLLDPEHGTMDILFDPNPEFVSIRLGSVTRLRWRNDRGLPAWGDLVLPPSYRPGSKLPLVIVQYQSRGFLRGGTGDEYPIFLLAQRGFAVLSFDRPPPVASLIPGLETAVQLNAANERGWAERRSIQSALLAGVDAAIALGVADPHRLGITGLSDGATAARFALINSDRFAAAAISSCCIEPNTVMTYGGTAWAGFNRAVGYPPATRSDPDFWKPVSVVAAAGRLKSPLLMQLSDDEYLLALEAFTALRENKDPVELLVYPDEHHVKWQPVHRLAVYRRSVDWFDFWLRCRPAPVPEEDRRWRLLRALAPSAHRLCP